VPPLWEEMDESRECPTMEERAFVGVATLDNQDAYRARDFWLQHTEFQYLLSLSMVHPTWERDQY
jgi:hypothetical protein